MYFWRHRPVQLINSISTHWDDCRTDFSHLFLIYNRTKVFLLFIETKIKRELEFFFNFPKKKLIVNISTFATGFITDCRHGVTILIN